MGKLPDLALEEGMRPVLDRKLMVSCSFQSECRAVMVIRLG
jgi:hypothetical protein